MANEQGYDIPTPPEPQKALTGFLVLIDANGTAVAYSDINTPVILDREPTLNEMYAGSAQVMKDVHTMQLTNHVVGNVVQAMMQVAQQQMQAAQDQQLASQLHLNRQQRRHG